MTYKGITRAAIKFECYACDTTLSEVDDADAVGTTRACPSCGKAVELDYHEYYDSETGDESAWYTGAPGDDVEALDAPWEEAQ